MYLHDFPDYVSRYFTVLVNAGADTGFLTGEGSVMDWYLNDIEWCIINGAAPS